MSNGKKGKGGKPKAPEVPKEAPADVKEFVDCKGKSLNFKGGKQTWVPLPDAAKKLGATPEITFEPGEKAGSIQVTIGISYVSITLPASVTNGELSVDTSSLPDMFGFGDAKKGIKDWTDQLNAWLKANGWKLDPPTVKDGAATLAKSAIGAAAPGQAAKDGANAQEPKKEEPKKEEPKGTPGKIKAAAATGAFLLGIGGGSLFSPGPEAGGAEQPTDPVPVEKVAQQPGEQTVLALPKGPVQANMTATPEGGGNPVQLQGTFTQEGQMLILVLPALPPFTGTIDDQASFDVENDVGSFVGRFVKNEVMGKHIFDGNPYTLTGTLSDSVEETTPP